MSAQLLKKRNHFHDIEDDRESALYVMLWTALRYTKHSQLVESEDDIPVKHLLAAFDEARPDGSGGVTGGSLKSSFLTGNSELRFDNRPQLDTLVTTLCRAFAFRYVRQLDPTNAGLVAIYSDRLKLLRTEGWLVNTMEQFLNADGWPNDDKAEPQDTVIQISTSHKRELDQTNINERDLKRFRYTMTR